MAATDLFPKWFQEAAYVMLYDSVKFDDAAELFLEAFGKLHVPNSYANEVRITHTS